MVSEVPHNSDDLAVSATLSDLESFLFRFETNGYARRSDWNGMSLPMRDQRLLQTARENGYLNARNRHRRELLDAHSAWCWRLKLPIVWVVRQTPRSKYGRIFLDMFTTPNALTPLGESKMRELLTELSTSGQGRISGHEISWDRIPRANLDAAARKTVRISTKFGCYAPSRANVPEQAQRPSLAEIDRWQVTSA
jgi:hypothetical protein